MIPMVSFSFCMFFLGASAPPMHKAQLQSEQSLMSALTFSWQWN